MTDQKEQQAEIAEPLIVQRPFYYPSPGQTIPRGPGVELSVHAEWPYMELRYYDKNSQHYHSDGHSVKENPFNFKTDFTMRVGNNAIHYRFLDLNGNGTDWYTSGWFNVQ
ncbi:hypothetical protein [Pseudomonas sp. GM60]|uniref:hypothetical protein n=1 Tax=Pseudomonas sp. GM60 TaxID=1144334 RepID=UPI000270CC9D|nr:hypothetical protein [Pseudomonas sp. GM60]EJM79762.1 hypothetical protein PMI32_04035 [Pseudomonas sp. GM60]